MSLKQRFLAGREAKNLTQADVARLLGVTRNAVSMWEAGKAKPKLETMKVLANIFDVNFDWLATGNGDKSRVDRGIPIVGEIAAGVWSEVSESQDGRFERVPVAPDPRYPEESQYALKIRGNSVNRVAKDGTIVICVDIEAPGVDLRDGDLVWVERHRGGLVEATIKRLRRGKEGPELWPESDDPAFQFSVPLPAPRGDSEVIIRGLVLYTVTPIPRGT